MTVCRPTRPARTLQNCRLPGKRRQDQQASMPSLMQQSGGQLPFGRSSMRKLHLAACALGTVLCDTTLTDRSLAAPLRTIDRPDGRWIGASTSVTPVSDRCFRCRDCSHSRRENGYYEPRYEPSVVYYGPSGAYRPYPPIVVYDYPIPAPYYPSWRYTSDYDYYRRW